MFKVEGLKDIPQGNKSVGYYSLFESLKKSISQESDKLKNSIIKHIPKMGIQN